MAKQKNIVGKGSARRPGVAKMPKHKSTTPTYRKKARPAKTREA